LFVEGFPGLPEDFLREKVVAVAGVAEAAGLAQQVVTEPVEVLSMTWR
jgi:hypothetical protein